MNPDASPLFDPDAVAEACKTLDPVPPPAMPARRKVRYSTWMADKICQMLAEGAPLHRICEPDGMPSPGQVVQWVRHNEEFRELYEEARRLQADILADRMLSLADECLGDDPKSATQYRVAADILAQQAKWRAPRQFGDRLAIDATVTPKSPEQVQAEIVALRTRLGIRGNGA